MLYSDDVVFGTPGDAKTMVDMYEQDPSIAGVIMAQEVDPSVVDKYGIIVPKAGTTDVLETIVEKPDVGSAPSHLASYGRYLVKPAIFNYLNQNYVGKDAELWTVDAITEMAKREKVLVCKTKAKWLTTGDPENYFRAHLEYVIRHEKYGNKLQGWLEEIQRENPSQI